MYLNSARNFDRDGQKRQLTASDERKDLGALNPAKYFRLCDLGRMYFRSWLILSIQDAAFLPLTSHPCGTCAEQMARTDGGARTCLSARCLPPLTNIEQNPLEEYRKRWCIVMKRGRSLKR